MARRGLIAFVNSSTCLIGIRMFLEDSFSCQNIIILFNNLSIFKIMVPNTFFLFIWIKTAFKIFLHDCFAETTFHYFWIYWNVSKIFFFFFSYTISQAGQAKYNNAFRNHPNPCWEGGLMTPMIELFLALCTPPCKLLGISLLITMCVVDVYSAKQAWVIIGIFVIRTALMNGPKALTRSIIMDQVPKEHRAKWSSLESFNTASWSGSAFIGGVLVDRFGILNNFYATSCLQAVALIPVLFILKRIPKEQ